MGCKRKGPVGWKKDWFCWEKLCLSCGEAAALATSPAVIPDYEMTVLWSKSHRLGMVKKKGRQWREGRGTERGKGGEGRGDEERDEGREGDRGRGWMERRGRE